MRADKTFLTVLCLMLALGSGVRAQLCKDANYTSYLFEGDFADDANPTGKIWTHPLSFELILERFHFTVQIDIATKLCECSRDNLERSGQLKDKYFECVESETLDTARFLSAKDDGEPNECSACLSTGCKKVVPANPEENQKICSIISGKEGETAVGRRAKRGIRIRCYFVFSWHWFFKIRLTWKCTITFSWGK